MIEDLKKQLKTQALAHWKDNLRRLRNRKWRYWLELSFEDRRQCLLDITIDEVNVHMGGNTCPYCQHYKNVCYDYEGNLCPLCEEGFIGRCCKEWRDVFHALAFANTKSEAIKAVKAMIRRIEEIE